MTRVFNLATQEEKFYFIPSALACVAAYAQERKDYNTWNYYKYWELLEYGPYTVICGDWTAFHS